MVTEVIDEEEQRIGILRETYLWRGVRGKERQRDPVSLPAQRLAERPEKLDGTLPPVRRDIPDIHRRGAILQKNDVGAGRPHHGNARGGSGEGNDAQNGRDAQGQPEGEIAEHRAPFADRQHAFAPVPPGVGTPAQHLPDPQHQQDGRRDQQPQVKRLGKAKGAEIDPERHRAYPLRTLGATLPASPFSRSFFSRGTYVLNLSSDLPSVCPSTPNGRVEAAG